MSLPTSCLKLTDYQKHDRIRLHLKSQSFEVTVVKVYENFLEVNQIVDMSSNQKITGQLCFYLYEITGLELLTERKEEPIVEVEIEKKSCSSDLKAEIEQEMHVDKIKYIFSEMHCDETINSLLHEESIACHVFGDKGQRSRLIVMATHDYTVVFDMKKLRENKYKPPNLFPILQSPHIQIIIYNYKAIATTCRENFNIKINGYWDAQAWYRLLQIRDKGVDAKVEKTLEELKNNVFGKQDLIDEIKFEEKEIPKCRLVDACIQTRMLLKLKANFQTRLEAEYMQIQKKILTEYSIMKEGNLYKYVCAILGNNVPEKVQEIAANSKLCMGNSSTKFPS